MAPVQLEQTLLTDAFPFVFVRADNNWLKIAWADILYLKSEEHYVQVVTEDVRYTLTTSLTACEQNYHPLYSSACIGRTSSMYQRLIS